MGGPSDDRQTSFAGRAARSRASTSFVASSTAPPRPVCGGVVAVSHSRASACCVLRQTVGQDRLEELWMWVGLSLEPRHPLTVVAQDTTHLQVVAADTPRVG